MVKQMESLLLFVFLESQYKIKEKQPKEMKLEMK
jgi:hypothetical protein